MADMDTIEIDNRGLQPPEPMVRILTAVSTMGEAGRVVALMDREPLPLYAELERRGLQWRFDDDGQVKRLTIWSGEGS